VCVLFLALRGGGGVVLLALRIVLDNMVDVELKDDDYEESRERDD
jgi:hypothetical protein